MYDFQRKVLSLHGQECLQRTDGHRVCRLQRRCDERGMTSTNMSIPKNNVTMRQTIILGNIITMDEKRPFAKANIVATIVDGEEVYKA